MVAVRKPNATYADVLAAPDDVIAELIDGELYLSARPRGRHGRVQLKLAGRLDATYGTAAALGGFGGWWIASEPECHLILDRRALVPDIAGWRRERMPSPPMDDHKYKVVPDWVCEVLSPSTQGFDTVIKMPAYLKAGVTWSWLIYPADRAVEVYRATEGQWEPIARLEGDTRARIAPFADIELDLGLWWGDTEI